MPPRIHHEDARMSEQSRFKLNSLLMIVAIVAIFIAIVLPLINRLREPGGRVPCASNMRQIGQALLLYSMDHGGRYPQQLEELLKDITEELLVCAETGEPSIFVRPGAIAADLTANDVVVYEPLSAHEGEGSMVLFGDGHVKWVRADGLERMLARPASPAATRSAVAE